MDNRKEALYTAFGELLYAVSMVDGEVQLNEAKKLVELIKDFPGAKEIEWSFEYEFDKKRSIEETYANALAACKWYGPSEDYKFLFNAVEQLAKASNGLSEKEHMLILRFRNDLQEYFDSLV